MNERKFTLVKAKNGRPKSGGPKNGGPQNGHPAPKVSPVKSPALTPGEMTEAARFKAMTAARAARQAMLHRIMADVFDLDQHSPAA
jgi:hypothetical protein